MYLILSVLPTTGSSLFSKFFYIYTKGIVDNKALRHHNTKKRNKLTHKNKKTFVFIAMQNCKTVVFTVLMPTKVKSDDAMFHTMRERM